MTDPTAASLLRLEVGRLRARRSRCFEPAVHVGDLGGRRWSCTVPMTDPVLDAGTRLEVVVRLLEQAQVARACCVLTRPGEPSMQDGDLAWLAAASNGFAAAGCTLTGMWTVTRTGWLDVRTGEQRTWKRLRIA